MSTAPHPASLSECPPHTVRSVSEFNCCVYCLSLLSCYAWLSFIEVPLGMKPNRNTDVPSPVLTSAASPGLWTHSLFAFAPSWPKRNLFKRESAVTPHLYGDISRQVQGTSENGVIFQKCAL
ncbi:Hypothetical predicted protein, partial [Marmota monax]